MKNDDGFYLPTVLTVTAFVLSFLATFIYIYHNDLVVSELTLQQIEAETLIQMSRQEFIQEAKNELPTQGALQYVYPNGKVTLQYERQTSARWLIICWMEIEGYQDRIQTQYTITTD